jgi:hypothetical protein
VIQDCITLRERGIRLTPTRQSSTATKWYLEAKFEAQPLTKARVGGGPLDQAGLAMLVQCRIGWFLTGNVLVHCKRIPDWFEDRYPFCDFDGEETLEHIFFDCPFWEQSRARHLSSVISEIDAMCVASTSVFDHNRLSWLLGGKYGGRGLSNWMPPLPLTLVDLGIGEAKAVAVGDEVDELAASFARLEIDDIVELTASFARLRLDGAEDEAAASSAVADGDAPSLAGSDSDDGSIGSEASEFSAHPYGNSCGSLAVARFLTVVARLRAVTIRSRWGQLHLEAGTNGVPTSTTGQRPNG